MKFNQKTLQIGLVFFGVLLILSTYFIYPLIKEEKRKASVVDQNIVEKEKKVLIDGEEANIFENVEYNGFYEIDNSFKVKSKKAHILEKDPNLVYMLTMHVTLHMKDGRVIVITSDKGTYNKTNYDLTFENNVNGTDGNTKILAENLDLLSDEDYASIYNNVILTSNKGSLRADKIDYDFETELYEISMYDDKPVKVKITR